MKILLKKTLDKILFLLCTLVNNNRGELNMRGLLLDRDQLKKKMSALWALREKRDWSNAERDDYDAAKAKAEKLNTDIKERGEFLEMFNNKPEVREHNQLKKKTSLFSIIKRELFSATRDKRFKVDPGPINECIQERSKGIDSQFLPTGAVPIADTDLTIQKRATIDTSAGSGGDLVQETISPDIVQNLYAMS